MFHVEHMEKINECPVCQKNSWIKERVCKDHTVSGELFQIERCAGCGFLMTNPRPKKENIGRYYQSSAYISHSDKAEGLVNRIYREVRKLTLASKYRLIRPFLSNPHLLDIGAGTGYFLKYCKDKGVQVRGVEPDSGARETAMRIHQIRLEEEQALLEMEDNSFSVITMWHVLEHVHDLDERIRQLRRLLKSDGRLLIAVPNPLSNDAAYYQDFWAAYDVPRHLYHFVPESIEKLFNRYGFRLEKMLPMKWDAYYVSMLSESYKNGKPGMLSAFLRGFLSNLRAKNGKYSSQIYIFSKNGHLTN